MAVLHDFRCRRCGKVFERSVDWNVDSVSCRECGGNSDRVFISSREYRAQAFEPVLVYRDKSGHIRFPGRNQGVTPKGYEAVYLRTSTDVRKFERQMNARERERYFEHKERHERRFEEWTRNARSELRQKMQHMSPAGRALAEAAMREGDRDSGVDMRFDAGFHLNAFAYDSGSREAWIDKDNGYKPRK